MKAFVHAAAAIDHSGIVLLKPSGSNFWIEFVFYGVEEAGSPAISARGGR